MPNKNSENSRSKKKPARASPDPRQLDLFGAPPDAANDAGATSSALANNVATLTQSPSRTGAAIAEAISPEEAANSNNPQKRKRGRPRSIAPLATKQAAPRLPTKARERAINDTRDEWWTTSTVCAYLKFGRKALWNMRRHPELGFPEPIDVAGNRHLYPGPDVRAWADAQKRQASERTTERVRALGQLKSKVRGRRAS